MKKIDVLVALHPSRHFDSKFWEYALDRKEGLCVWILTYIYLFKSNFLKRKIDY